MTTHDDAEFFGDEGPSAAEQAWWASISDGIDRADDPPDTTDPPTPPTTPPATTNGHRPAPTITHNERALIDGHRPTDLGNADRLVATLDGHARYVDQWGKWIVWTDDGVWRIDTNDARIAELAKQVPRAMFTDAAATRNDDLWKWAKRTESAAAIASMIRLTRGTPGVLVDHHDLDNHPWLLNVANGTIDLRTGQLGAHNPDHLITKQAPTRYEPEADAPLWEQCLATWQPDPDVRDYLARVIGSAATGQYVEHVFVNLGGGANGKGKFYGAVQHVLGADYAVVPHKSLLIVQRHEQHDTVKARLFGARMAVAGETEAGDRLDEAKVKELTGGDLLEARRMREDPWQFRPSHTLFLHTNHRPRVRGGDEGIWRRLRLIPWDVTIPADQRDPRLAERLEAESPGILNWIIAGCAAWQTEGLHHPQAVDDATHTYRAEEDHVGRFLADCTTPDDHGSILSYELRRAYERWCLMNGETPWSAKALGPQLLAKGLDREKKSGAYRWIGAALIEVHDDSDPGPTPPTDEELF